MLQVADVGVRFGSAVALDGVSLEVEDGEVAAVLGASGSGKTTLLRVIAGLQPQHTGEVRWNGESLAGIPPHRRGFGLMFQDYALFPHLDVAANVAFGLAGRAGVEARVREMLDAVGLTGYGSRSVTSLSGGEQQRVALARALAPEPRMLMLDEPLGSLDRTLREHLVGELAGLFHRLSVTAVYVTHDQEEAFTIADRILVLGDGRVAQAGTPEEVWNHPSTEWIARFLGFDMVVDIAVDGAYARGPWGTFPAGDLPPGTHRAVVRPDALELDEHGTVQGTVAARAFRGGRYALTVAPPEGPPLEVEVDARRAPEQGAQVRLAIDPEAVVVVG